MLIKIKNFFVIIIFLFPAIIFSLTDSSIYNLKIDLLDHRNKTKDISDLSGKVQIFSMIYTNCKTVCPIIVSNMKNIEKLLSKYYLDNIEFTLVSLDPERDDVESLNRFFIEKKLNNKNWFIYKTSKDNTLKLALLTGIKFKKEQNDYVHSNLIIILDKYGSIKFYHQGLNKDFNEVLKIIKSLV